jgi:xylulokinase
VSEEIGLICANDQGNQEDVAVRRELLLGIDIGTQGTRVALVDPAGKVLASRSNDYKMVTPCTGWAEEDPDDWWHAAISGIQQVIKASGAGPEEIVAIGSDAQMHATVPIGPSGDLLSHGVQLWCDKRSARLVDEYKGKSFATRAASLAGSPPVAAWVGFKIRWLKNHQPESYAKTWKFLTGSGYINYRLTGEVSIDWSEASGTYLLDAETLAWSEELAGYLEIDLQKLPPVSPSASIIGRVNRQAASLTGLLEGTPVIAGAGDMMAMGVAAGLSKQGSALDISGTASDMVVYVDKPIVDPPMMNLHHALPGWIPFGIAEAGGGSLEWFKDALCQAEVIQAKAEGRNVYTILDEKAASVEPGGEGLLYLPYLMGERVLGSPHSRGVFFGLTPRSSIGAMTRAIMEGVTFELRRTLEIVERAGNRINTVFTSGGGARSNLWSQIKADIYRKRVLTLAESEGGVIGSAVLAGVGAGVFPDVQSGARRFVKVNRVFEPDPSNQARYEYLYILFKELHDTLQPRFEKLSLAP